MLWDPQRQTWHDKLASSVVIRTWSTRTSSRVWTGVS